MSNDTDERGTPLGETITRRQAGVMASLVIGAIVIAGLYFGRPVVEPFALAVLLSLLLGPAVRWLQHKRVGRVTAVVVTVGLAAIVVLGFVAAVGEEVIGLARNLPEYEQNLSAKIRSLSGVVPGGSVLGRATQVFRDLSNELSARPGPSGPLANGIPGVNAPVPVELRQPEPAPLQVLRDVVGPLLQPLANGGLVLLFTTIILLKREDLRDRVLRLAGVSDLHRTTAAMNEAAERVSRYLLMQLAVGVCFGVPVAIGLAVIGIPSAPLWGGLGVVMRFVPYLGGPLTATMPVALAIAVDPGWSLVLWTVLLFATVELLLANVVEPWLYARTTGLSSFAVIAAASFWTWLWGTVGLLLATPLTVCLVVLGRYLPQLQFLEILLGNRPVLSPEESFYQRLIARDPEEATEQAEEFIKEKSLESFYDEVAIPALLMAQTDSDRGVFAGNRRAVIAEGFAAIIDNLAEDIAADPDNSRADQPAIACLAARNELDLAAAWLLRDLLRRRGLQAEVYSPDALSTFSLDRLPLHNAAIVCLSVISTTSAARARYLVRRIRRQARRARLVIGFWGQNGQDFSISEALTGTAADQVVTSLAAAVADIEAALAPPHPALEPPTERLARQSA